MNPDNLKYTKDHEWMRIEGETATVGITDNAQQKLGDITYVELPAADESFDVGETFGTVESVKAAGDCNMPVAGTIIEINESLEDAPETVNKDPYGEGWLVKISITDPSQVEGLMDAAAYGQFAESEG